MGRLEGRVALITGAARGQGAAEARLFAEEGALVVVTDVLADEASSVAAELGARAVCMPLDVTSEDAWNTCVSQVTEQFGRVDILVNNAGTLDFGALAEMSVDAYRRVVDVNQLSVFLGMRAVVPVMGRGSSIVNVSSIFGLVGMPGVIAYAATKFAVRGMTKVAALELASSGIRVNSIHPGTIETPMLREVEADIAELVIAKVPMERVADPVEVARLAVFLASEESSYCTGSEFTIDGGILAGVHLAAGAQ